MSFGISAGVYPREIDKSVVVPSGTGIVAGIVIDSPKGPSNQIVTITNNKQFVDTFGKPTPDRPAMYSALAFLERGNNLKVVRVVGAGAVKASTQFADNLAAQSISITALSEGTWGNSYDVKLTNIDSVKEQFTLEVIHDTTGEIVETFIVSKNVTKKDGYGRSMFIEDVINGVSEYILAENFAGANYPDDGGAGFVTNSLNGGGNGASVTSSEVIGGFGKFAVKEEIDVSLLIQGGWDLLAVQQYMVGLCENRQDCIAILDVPYSTVTSITPVDSMVTYVSVTMNIDSSYAAIYGGWVKAYDQYNDKILELPPSGYVAGAVALTERVSEVWYAPAGINRGKLNVLGVTNIFTEGDRDTLYKARINPIQSFIGEGIQIFGQKTLQSVPSALDRVNVRMLMITLMNSISKAMRPFVFEFNDTFTRENISSILNSYMTDIQSRRGVVDFLIVCDDTNNTAQVIDQNKMIVDVYVKPTRAAEFIQVNGIITATGASFRVQG